MPCSAAEGRGDAHHRPARRLQGRADARDQAPERPQQLSFADLEPDERQQLTADRAAWQERLDRLPKEREEELARIADRYAHVDFFIFPAAVVHLVPAAPTDELLLQAQTRQATEQHRLAPDPRRRRSVPRRPRRPRHLARRSARAQPVPDGRPASRQHACTTLTPARATRSSATPHQHPRLAAEPR